MRYSDDAALRIQRYGTDLMCGCQVWEQVEPDAVLQVEEDGRTIPFDELFFQVDIVKSGMHHPDGMLWLRSPQRTHIEHPEKVGLASIAPAILRMYGLPVPDHMNRETTLA